MAASRRLWRRLVGPDVVLFCFRPVSSAPQNGFVAIFVDLVTKAGGSGSRNLADHGGVGGRALAGRRALRRLAIAGGLDLGADLAFPVRNGARQGVKIACLAPLGALR